MRYLYPDDAARIAAGDFNGGAAVVIVHNARGEYLLLLRDDKPDIVYPAHWTIPGGMQETGETPHQTAVRELAEEIGYNAPALTLFAQTIDTGGRREHIHAYTCLIDCAISELTQGEGTDMRFFTAEEIRTLHTIPFVRDLIALHVTA